MYEYVFVCFMHTNCEHMSLSLKSLCGEEIERERGELQTDVKSDFLAVLRSVRLSLYFISLLLHIRQISVSVCLSL